MAVEHLEATLQVCRFNGGAVKTDEFLDKLVVESGDNVKKRKRPNARVDVMTIQQTEFADAEEPSEAFAETLAARLHDASIWLNKQDVELFDELRAKGFNTDFLITGWINADQLDLDLPPSLLRACGTLGLKITIITND